MTAKVSYYEVKCRHRYIRIQGTMLEVKDGAELAVVCTECGETVSRAVVTQFQPVVR